MGLVRKHSLKQLMDIQKLMNVCGDIGEEETDKIEDYYDTFHDTDVNSEAVFDMSNEIQKSLVKKNADYNYLVRFGQGNLGECIGDLTDQTQANSYWQHNPFNDSVIDTYEEFDLQFNFAPSWKRNLTPKGKLKKVDESVKWEEDIKPKSIHIKRFDEI